MMWKIRRLNKLEAGKQYQIKIWNSFAALEDLNNSEDINGFWENIKENIETSSREILSLYELKQHESSFGEECLRFRLNEPC